MTDKHTPGPWETAGECEYVMSRHAPSGATNRVICENVFSDADARLIAAAPELLAALHAIKAAIEAPGSYRDTVNAVDRITQAAIAKATE